MDSAARRNCYWKLTLVATWTFCRRPTSSRHHEVKGAGTEGIIKDDTCRVPSGPCMGSPATESGRTERERAGASAAEYSHRLQHRVQLLLRLAGKSSRSYWALQLCVCGEEIFLWPPTSYPRGDGLLQVGSSESSIEGNGG
jgi:hypothetical protein